MTKKNKINVLVSSIFCYYSGNNCFAKLFLLARASAHNLCPATCSMHANSWNFIACSKRVLASLLKFVLTLGYQRLSVRICCEFPLLCWPALQIILYLASRRLCCYASFVIFLDKVCAMAIVKMDLILRIQNSQHRLLLNSITAKISVNCLNGRCWEKNALI